MNCLLLSDWLFKNWAHISLKKNYWYSYCEINNTENNIKNSFPKNKKYNESERNNTESNTKNSFYRNRNLEEYEINNTENSIKNSFYNKNKFNNNIRLYSSSYRPTTCSNSSKQKTIFFNPINKTIPYINKNNTYSLTEISTFTNSNKNNNYIHKFNFLHKKKNLFKNEKNMKNEIKEILNDTKIIKDSIVDKIEKNYSQEPKYNDKVLLKLANKLYKPKKINYKIFKKQDENELTLENEYVRKLKKIPKSCKEEYRDCFKEILYQDRILNKNNPKEIDILDERMKYLHEQKKIQEEAYKTMYLLKENILTGKEDDEVFKEEKIFDSYGNITGLEWLIKKKYVMDEKKKLTGAFNPKEKTHFIINYPA